jgi:hypothetical protein
MEDKNQDQNLNEDICTKEEIIQIVKDQAKGYSVEETKEVYSVDAKGNKVLRGLEVNTKFIKGDINALDRLIHIVLGLNLGSKKVNSDMPTMTDVQDTEIDI